MSTTRPATHAETTPETRRAWEAPAMTELKLSTGTRSSGDAPATEEQPAHPPLPTAAAGKPGLSIEWAFPMAVKSGE